MELSPEEKQRIYQEEKARVEAQGKLKKEAQTKKAQQGCLGCLGIVIAFFILVGIVGSQTSNSGSVPRAKASDAQEDSTQAQPSSHLAAVSKRAAYAAHLERLRKHEEAREQNARLQRQLREAEAAAARARESEPRLVLRPDWSISETDGGYIKITGRVVNKMGQDLSYAEISFNCYDKSGDQVGTAMTNTTNLENGGTWKFEAVALVSSEEVARARLAALEGH